MSLKSTLNQIIKDRGGEVFTIDELEAYCKKANYKLSNAERRLRPSESQDIERVMKKGYIIGYRYAQNNTQRVDQEARPSNEPVRDPAGQTMLHLRLNTRFD